MDKYKFKTNINCNACKSAVTPFLNKESRISKWDVDLSDPSRILSVEGDNIDSKVIVELISAAGYIIQEI